MAKAPDRRARFNRDDLRAMLHGGRLGTTEQEAMVTAVQHTGIRKLPAVGIDVAADDTHRSDAPVAARLAAGQHPRVVTAAPPARRAGRVGRSGSE